MRRESRSAEVGLSGETKRSCTVSGRTEFRKVSDEGNCPREEGN